MKELIITLILMALIITIDVIFGLVSKTHQRKDMGTYLLIFFMMLSAVFFNKAYGFEKDDILFLENFPKEENVKYFDRDLKFVPPGVPEEHIKRDDSLSDIAIDLIRNTSKEEALWSRKLHAKKAKEYYAETKDLCWFLPRITDREKAKMVFTSAMAAVPGPVTVKFVASFLCLATQYGINMIDEWFEIKFAMDMCNYHLNVVKEYNKYIRQQGW